MQRLSPLLLAFGLVALAVRASFDRAVAEPESSRAQAVPIDELVAEFDRLAERPLWPGFEPRAVPFAVYDGSVTWLVRHPDPPEPFRRRDLESAIWFMPGRHDAVRANSHAAIGDTLAATLIAEPAGGHTAEQLAATLIHETFHVYQATEHRDWFANELQLLSYPWEAPESIGLRRLEGDALQLALNASGAGGGACWAARALGFRRARYAGMPAESAEYERRLELAEGLASYVEGVASGLQEREIMSGQPFPPEAIRQRAYASGHALAVLLSRHVEVGWQLELERATQPLDQLLAAALAEPSDSICGFSRAEIEVAAERAELDVAAALAARATARAEYLARPGWRLEVVGHGEPLWPNGFDPLNMRGLGGREVLHTRWLALGNRYGEIEVLDRAALTAGAGEHPLFQGVRQAILTGLSAEPVLEAGEGRLLIRGEGIRGEFTGARVERVERLIVIHLSE